MSYLTYKNLPQVTYEQVIVNLCYTGKIFVQDAELKHLSREMRTGVV